VARPSGDLAGSLRMIREHWLFGVGLGRFWDYFEQYRINTYYTRYPHNFLLEVFAIWNRRRGRRLMLVLSYERHPPCAGSRAADR